MTPLAILAKAVDFAGSLVVAAAVVRVTALYLRARCNEAPAQRRLLASGLVFGLSFKSAAGLVRSTTVHTWNEIGVFVAIVALRFFLGRTLKQSAAAPGAARGPRRRRLP